MGSNAGMAEALTVALSRASMRSLAGATLFAFLGAMSPAHAQYPLEQRQLQLRIQELKLQQSQQELMQEQRFQQQQLQPYQAPLQQQQLQLQQLQLQQGQAQQVESLRLQEQQRRQIKEGASASEIPAILPTTLTPF